MEDLIPIGKFSRICGISIRSLRHYDKIGLLKPEYVDEENGYRFYSFTQFNAADNIRLLRYLDVPLDRIGKIIHESDKQKIIDLVEFEFSSIEEKIIELNEKRECLKRICNNEGVLISYNIFEKTLEPQNYAYLNLSTNFQKSRIDIIESYNALRKTLFNYRIEIVNSPFILMTDDEINEEDINMRICLPIEERSNYPRDLLRDCTPRQRVLTAIHQGSHSIIRGTYKEIYKRAAEQYFEIVPPIRETYLVSHRDSDNIRDYRTEVSCPIKN